MFASVVTLVNNVELYKKMVVSSLKKEDFELVPVFFPESAAEGLNEGIEKSKEDLIICCHQDVSFPETWKNIVEKYIRYYDDFGVMGTFGKTMNYKCAGNIYNPYPKVYKVGNIPCEVMSLDEHCLIIRKSSGLRFDESNPYFHAYGGDLCLLSIEKGCKNYVFPSGGLNHLSPKGKHDYTFDLSVEWFISKWRGNTKLREFHTMCFEVNFETGRWRHYF